MLNNNAICCYNACYEPTGTSCCLPALFMISWIDLSLNKCMALHALAKGISFNIAAPPPPPSRLLNIALEEATAEDHCYRLSPPPAQAA